MQHPQHRQSTATTQQQTPKSSDIVKSAVKLAGGYEAVAAYFGISPQAVSAWQTKGTIPARYIRALCSLGNHIISVDAVLAAIERTAADKVDA